MEMLGLGLCQVSILVVVKNRALILGEGVHTLQAASTRILFRAWPNGECSSVHASCFGLRRAGCLSRYFVDLYQLPSFYLKYSQYPVEHREVQVAPRWFQPIYTMLEIALLGSFKRNRPKLSDSRASRFAYVCHVRAPIATNIPTTLPQQRFLILTICRIQSCDYNKYQPNRLVKDDGLPRKHHLRMHLDPRHTLVLSPINYWYV